VSEVSKSKTVFYASVGPALTLYDIDIEGAALVKRGAVTLPANIQYAWPHPSRRYLYVVSSNGGPGIPGDKHFASALLIDPATGALRLHGEPVALPSRPIHTSVDGDGAYLLTAFNAPSNVTVHHLNTDGTIGAPVLQSAKGALSNLASIAPGNGLGFGPRHLDFHPTRPWAFVSIERQNKLYVYRLDQATGLARDPMFIRDTLSDPASPAPQGAGAIHVHPNGRFVYVTNRTFPSSGPGAREVSAGGENSVAVFAIDQTTGEPNRIQSIDGRGIQLRTFGIDPSGRLLAVASIMALEDGTLPAGITVMRVGNDGKLEFVRKYDIDTGKAQQFWSGMVTLA